MAKAVIPLMKQQRSGSIIQMSSINGWIAQPEFHVIQHLIWVHLIFDVMLFVLVLYLHQLTVRHANNLKISLDELVADQVKNQCLKRLNTTQEMADFTVF